MVENGIVKNVLSSGRLKAILLEWFHHVGHILHEAYVSTNRECLLLEWVELLCLTIGKKRLVFMTGVLELLQILQIVQQILIERYF